MLLYAIKMIIITYTYNYKNIGIDKKMENDIWVLETKVILLTFPLRLYCDFNPKWVRILCVNLFCFIFFKLGVWEQYK